MPLACENRSGFSSSSGEQQQGRSLLSSRPIGLCTSLLVPRVTSHSHVMAADAIPATVAALRSAFDSGRTRSLSWRLDQLAKLRAALRAYRPRLIEATHLDMGRPEFECVNIEIAPLDGEIALLERELPAFVEPEHCSTPLTLAPASTTRTSEPKGVVLILTPWNFPFALSIGPLACAIAAGNAALVKPSEKAPRCSALLAELIRSTLDPAAVAIVEGGPQVGQRLLGQKYDHIFYTGSGEVAKSVYAAAAKHLTPCTLELGGKNAAYVHSDVEVPTTARRLLHGSMVNCGQFCCGVDIAYVHRGVSSELIGAIKALLLEWYGDDPRSSPSFGRVISPQSAWRMQRLLESCGGEVVCGGHVDVDARYVAPTIVLNPMMGSPLRADETFGPILCLVEVSHVDEAIALQRSLPTPLCKYVFARDGSVATDYMARVAGGMGCINDTMFQAANPEVPFGGFGASGFGAYHGMRGVRELSHCCGTLHQPLLAVLDPPFRYPPYTASKVNLLAFVLRYPGSPLAAWLAKAGKLVRPLLVALLVLLAYRIGRRRGAAAALGLVLRTR